MTTTGVVPPAHAVDRPALRRRLDEALSQPLTLIVAPAGSGKSVLVAQWAASHAELSFVWLQIDALDDDPVHFAQGLLRSLVAISPEFGDLGSLIALHGGGLGPALLEELTVQLAEVPEVVIVFEDFHKVSNAVLLSDLSLLVDLLPANVHLLLLTRTDLPLAWSRHRVQLDFTEIRQGDLALDVVESAELLKRIAGKPLSAESVIALVNRTEGWAAGLQLAAMTLRLHDDPDGFIIEFSGSDRLVADYLSDEVLAAQPNDRRVLLLHISVLDELSADLVAYVTGEPNAQLLLEELEDQSMFLVALDTHRSRYRFHHLFQDLLRYRLKAEDPSAEVPLLKRAAAWCLEQGEVDRAVEFLLRAREWESIIEIIMTRGSEVFERGEMATVIRWIEEVPASVRAGKHDLNLLLAFLKGADGQALASEDISSKILTDPNATVGERFCATAFLVLLAQWRPRPETTVDFAVHALDALDNIGDIDRVQIPSVIGLTNAHSLRATILISGGRAHFLAGNLEEARDWLELGLASTGAAYSIWKVSALGSLGLLEAWCGHTRRAEALADEALAVALEVGSLAHPSTADAYLALTFVALERGQPNKAALSLHEGALRAQANKRMQLMWVSLVAQALLQAAEGLTEEATETILSATRELGSEPPPVVADRLVALRCQMLRLGGSPEQATQIAQEAASESHFVTFELAMATLALGQACQAHKLIHALPPLSDDTRPLARIEHRLLAALLSDGEHRASDAQMYLRDAMTLGERHSHVEVFVNAGPTIVRLMSRLSSEHQHFRETILKRGRELFSTSERNDLANPLTDRELEILTFLPRRLTNSEIAKQCYVSINTMKTHMAHIYQKLGAANRNDAVNRAQEIGLL
jgi:LuxR family maltose regulon positive regulatory protein